MRAVFGGETVARASIQPPSEQTKIMRAVSFLAALPRSGCPSVATAGDRSHDISEAVPSRSAG